MWGGDGGGCLQCSAYGMGGLGWVSGYEGKKKSVYLKWASHVCLSSHHFILPPFFDFGWVGGLGFGGGGGICQITPHCTLPPPAWISTSLGGWIWVGPTNIQTSFSLSQILGQIVFLGGWVSEPKDPSPLLFSTKPLVWMCMFHVPSVIHCAVQTTHGFPTANFVSP